MYEEDHASGTIKFPRHVDEVLGVELEKRIIFGEGLPLQANHSISAWGETEEIKQVQAKAMEFLAEHRERDCIVTMPCGYGKSYVGIREAIEYGRWTIVFAHNTGILEDWRKKLLAATDLGEDQIGSIISGTLDLKPVTLALFQSFLALPEETQEFVDGIMGLAIFDEVHHVSARTFFSAANKLSGRRIGLSATPIREDGTSWVYQCALGTNHYIGYAERKKAAVEFIYVDFRCDVDSSYQRLVTQLAYDQAYMQRIEADIRRDHLAGEKQLIISSRRVMIETLAQMLSDLDVGVIHQDISREERTRALRSKRITIATPNLAQEGLDDPSLTVLRVITPMRNRNNLVQVVGRLERDLYSKDARAIFYVPRINQFVSTAQKAKLALARSGYVISTR